MKARKVADIIDNIIVVLDRQDQNKVAEILGKLPLFSLASPENELRWDMEAIHWSMEYVIGKGSAERKVIFPIAPQLYAGQLPDSPILIADGGLIFFQNRFYVPERLPRNEAEREELKLRVKKLYYREQTELSNLRAEIANIEATIEYTKTGPKRMPIPEDVKLRVWARDGGACVRCGSKENLQFDHIIPLDKGGSNTVENIQILCQRCNLLKSDKISWST